MRKTHEQFVAELLIINPNIEVIGTYVSAKTKILVKCKIDGHEWHATPDNLLRGRKCPRCTGHVRRSHEEFVSEIAIINPNVEIIGNFINTSTKILCRCKIDGFEWMANPNDLLKGSGCPKCIGRYKTHDEFITELSVINPNIEILTKYVDSNTKVLCKCKIDGYEWYALPYSLLQGKGCPRCIGRHKTHEEFVSEMFIVNPNIEIKSKYIDSKTKILCKCKIDGNEWWALPHTLLKGFGCPICGIQGSKEKQRKSHEEFVAQMVVINPNVEILGEYVNSHTNIKCRCKIDGCVWEATPTHLLLGTGCPKCGGTLKKTHEQFITEMKIINPDIEILSIYINNKTKVLCRCKKCGHEWEATPSHLLSYEGCPNCYKSKGENRIEVFLKNNSVHYILHHKYEGLIGLGGNLLSYDFYLPNYNILIEYQGRQHYEPVDMFGGEEQFVIQQEHDKRKREYAKSHNINLLEIPYWEFKNIEQILESRLLKQSASLIA